MIPLSFRTYVGPKDPEHVREMAVSTGFFYDFEVPVAVELVEECLVKGEEESGYFFIFVESEGKPLAYSCYGPIAGTEGSFDLFWIVTHNDYRGMGIGKVLLERTQEAVRRKGGRLLIAETSSLEKYTPTRAFYEKNGYIQESFIADYYKPGDGKVTYVKRLD
jgi:ribosomal protein S18 acetylase RimI-like enzyme